MCLTLALVQLIERKHKKFPFFSSSTFFFSTNWQQKVYVYLKSYRHEWEKESAKITFQKKKSSIWKLSCVGIISSNIFHYVDLFMASCTHETYDFHEIKIHQPEKGERKDKKKAF